MENEILEAINSGPERGMMLKEIGVKLNKSRQTIVRYVGILEAKNKVTVEKLGSTYLIKRV